MSSYVPRMQSLLFIRITIYSEKLRKENLDVTFVLLDVTNIETVRTAEETIEKNHGRLDVLVNNAGRV